MISIIVPVYQVVNYIKRCLDSLCAQTYKDYEIVLVDDGSTDGSGEICDEYSNKHDNVIVVHQENKGLSNARNIGLAHASGDFIAFVDGDDWVSPDFLSSMMRSLLEKDADICECSVIRTSCYQVTLKNEENPDIILFDTVHALKELIVDGVFKQHVWNKLYKRSCIDTIMFPKFKTNEDEFWTYKVFSRAKSIARLYKGLYYYYQRSGSIMGREYSFERLDALDAKQERQLFIENNYPQLSDIALINMYLSCIYAGQMTLSFIIGANRSKAIKRIDILRRRCTPKYRQMNRIHGTEKVWIIMAKSAFWLTIRIKNLLKRGF